MNATPLNTLFPAPVAQLVYSDGRWRRFRFCKRGFLFHYVVCRGGYESFQPAPIRQLYYLKHLLPFDGWLNRILFDAVRNVCTVFYTPNRWKQQLQQQALTRLARDCHHLRRESWRDDPAGYPQLSELRFGQIDAFALNRRAEEALRLRLEQLYFGYGEELARYSPGGFVHYADALSVHFQEMTVFLAPALIWREGPRLRWLVPNLPAEPDDAWIRYYAWTKLCASPIHVEPEFADFARGEAMQLPPEEFNFSEAGHRALERARIMRDWLVDAADAPPEAIEPTHENCSICRYREYCLGG